MMISDISIISALNTFLSVVYKKKDYCLSNVLINAGFHDDDVTQLRNHATEIANGCITLVRKYGQDLVCVRYRYDKKRKND